MNKEIGGCGGGGGADGGGGGGGSGGGGGGSWPSSSSLRRRSGPPGFLTKTFSMVDDPNTNFIISWGKYGNSFIIWDHIQFSAEILPKYFKHSNLSSFVYQLNNYGFRKIGVNDHQWEYENPDFQAGKVHLLTKIKRRGQNPEYVSRRGPRRALCNNIRPEILRKDMNESKLEIEKLKMQQTDMEFHIMALEEDAKNVENKLPKLIMYWAKACEIIAKKMREETGKENSDDEVRKKRKLDTPEKNETNSGLEDLEGKNNQDQEEMVKEDTIPLSENQPISSTNYDSNDHEANANSEATLEKNSGDYTFWKKILMEDDEACEGGAGTEMTNKQAKIVLDLEDLITKLDDN